GEELVRWMVFAQVREEEPPIFAFAQAPLRSAVGRADLAARPVAARALRAQPAIFPGLDPDAIEQGRVEFHGRRLCGPDRAGRKLAKYVSLVPSAPVDGAPRPRFSA